MSDIQPAKTDLHLSYRYIGPEIFKRPTIAVTMIYKVSVNSVSKLNKRLSTFQHIRHTLAQYRESTERRLFGVASRV